MILISADGTPHRHNLVSFIRLYMSPVSAILSCGIRRHNIDHPHATYLFVTSINGNIGSDFAQLLAGTQQVYIHRLRLLSFALFITSGLFHYRFQQGYYIFNPQVQRLPVFYTKISTVCFSCYPLL
ncbi:uncharacterized protein LOC144771932 [Lissotriton helveticus]